jgi:hypothetical protein
MAGTAHGPTDMTRTFIASDNAADARAANTLTSSPVTAVPTRVYMAALQAHCALLLGAGISDLGALGKMGIGGNVIIPTGLIRPSVSGNQRRGVALFSEAYQIRRDARGAQFQKISGTAALLQAIPLTIGSRRQGLDLLVNVSYLVAETLTLAAGTNLILLNPLQHLIILADQLIVGPNVTITYERAPTATPAVPPKPEKPATPSQPAPFSQGGTGTGGIAGVHGGMGQSFNAAPEIEIWTLDIVGTPAVDLRGQNGGPGGTGGPGGDGGNGGQGSNGKDAWVGCKYGPGGGGNGGIGGRSGDGGLGGNGGPGGRFQFFAPSAEIASLVSGGFYFSVDGGQPGAGGAPGAPGAGGAGGPIGGYPPSCKGAAASRTVGTAGAPGPVGQPGPAGHAGPVSGSDPVKFVPIQPADFLTALAKPAIISLSTSYAHEGDQVSVNGKDLAATDIVKFQVSASVVVPCKTTVFSSTSATFVVPAVPGGPRAVFIEQSDGTRTNPSTLYVLPTVTGLENGPRVRPGTSTKIFGTGLAPGARLIINGMDMGATTYIDPHSVSAVIVRPSGGVQPNPDGEVVALQLALQDLTKSNATQIILDTYKMVVVGDSVAWGCGLTESDKFSTLVEQRVKQLSGGEIGVYREVAAHTGAIIGSGFTVLKPQLHGEVPSDWPTILQQVAAFAGQPNAQFVDLVLVDGGINDLGLSTLFDWESAVDLGAATAQYCLTDMKELLVAVGNTFPTARVVVTGYFAPLSSESADSGAEQLMIAILAASGFDVHAVTASQREKVYLRCSFFQTQANNCLAQAVAATNTAFGGPARVFFADPQFGPSNAVFASVPWLFGLNADFSPQDAMKGDRAGYCATQASDDDKQFCVRASMGHPNRSGAEAYANAIYPFLA